MVSRWRVWACTLVLLLLVAPPALAQGGVGGRVIFGDDFVLRTDERLDGDLVVFGGHVTLEPGSWVRGAVLAFGGDVRIAGHVDRDVSALGGNVVLEEGALVGGDVVTTGRLTRAPDAVVSGLVVGGGEERRPEPPSLGSWLASASLGVDWARRMAAGFGSWVMQTIVGTWVVVSLGIVVALLIPGLTRTVSEVLVGYPAESVGVGLLTLLVAVLAVPLLIITCLGIPLAIVGLIVLAVAALFGWIGAGLAMGARLLQAWKVEGYQPFAAVAVGLLPLTLLASLPVLGSLVVIGVGSWGLGSVVLTRFGTVLYRRSIAHAVGPTASPPAATGDSAHSS